MTDIIGLAVYALGAFAMWQLRSHFNRASLEMASKGIGANRWAILFVSSVFWPITMPLMFLGLAQRRLFPPKGDERPQPERRRKPKSQRGRP